MNNGGAPAALEYNHAGEEINLFLARDFLRDKALSRCYNIFILLASERERLWGCAFDE
jgi:hypothetical protein